MNSPSVRQTSSERKCGNLKKKKKKNRIKINREVDVGERVSQTRPARPPKMANTWTHTAGPSVNYFAGFPTLYLFFFFFFLRALSPPHFFFIIELCVCVCVCVSEVQRRVSVQSSASALAQVNNRIKEPEKWESFLTFRKGKE